MATSELKLRVIFATCALIALLATIVQLTHGLANVNWPLLGAMSASLLVSAAEALGILTLAKQAHWRLVASVLLGVATLYTLECCASISMQA